MAQRFLVSAASRVLSLLSAYKAEEDAPYELLCQMCLLEAGGEVVFPCCGYDEANKIIRRRKFKCKVCNHQISIASSIVFA